MAIPARIIMDFTDVKDQSPISPTHQPPGDYKGFVKAVDYSVSQNENKTPQLVYVIADADRPSATYRYNCPLTKPSAWKIRNLFIAAGVEVPKKRMNIASVAEKILNREIGMTLDDDEYEGRLRSQIQRVFPVGELPADEDEETPAQRRKARRAAEDAKRAKAKPGKKDEELEDVDEEEDEDLDELELDDL
jgi:hypothetical protein